MKKMEIIFKCLNCKKEHSAPTDALLCCNKDLVEKEKILSILKEKCPELTIGSWKCEKSFYGYCIQKNNGHDDECIFCGEPDDRQ